MPPKSDYASQRVNQVKVNDINFPPLTTRGRTVPNNAKITKNFSQMDTFQQIVPLLTAQPTPTPGWGHG